MVDRPALHEGPAEGRQVGLQGAAELDGRHLGVRCASGSWAAYSGHSRLDGSGGSFLRVYLSIYLLSFDLFECNIYPIFC